MKNRIPVDFYKKKLTGEPHFTLLARDPMFATLIKQWADRRNEDMNCGERPESDRDQILNARLIAAEGTEWRYRNKGKWRKNDTGR